MRTFIKSTIRCRGTAMVPYGPQIAIMLLVVEGVDRQTADAPADLRMKCSGKKAQISVIQIHVFHCTRHFTQLISSLRSQT